MIVLGESLPTRIGSDKTASSIQRMERSTEPVAQADGDRSKLHLFNLPTSTAAKSATRWVQFLAWIRPTSEVSGESGVAES
jgi:hypothetical protein